MLTNNLPHLDLHGEDRDSARILVEEFLNDNYKLKKMNVVIVHGIGEGVLKKTVHDTLKRNIKVKAYKLDNFNLGCTLVSMHHLIDKTNKKCYNTQHVARGGNRYV